MGRLLGTAPVAMAARAEAVVRRCLLRHLARDGGHA